MRALRSFLGFLLFLATLGARATPLTYNASDIWWVPEESGWGVNLIHQGNTLFATLFVYGADGNPRWYSASDLVTPGDGPAHDRSLAFTGDLHESTGPAFPGPVDPNAVTRRRVGTMTFEMFGPASARLTYSVDGVQVTKNVQRYLFRNPDLSGEYVGYQYQPAEGIRPAILDSMSISIQQSGGNFSMTTAGSASGACRYTGTLTAYGQLADVNGTFNCDDGRTGPFKLSEVDVTRNGFTSRMTGNLISAPFQGRFATTRMTSGQPRGDGWRTDLWWIATESGWGVNVIEEGDVLFTTFFIYGANGQSKWYSTSLVFSGMSQNLDGSGRYTGTIYESRGPGFGAGAFNPGAVTYNAVGTATLEVIGNRTAWLDFTINGVSGRKVLDRFTFRTNDPTGDYDGFMVPLANERGVPTGSTTFNVTLASGTFRMITSAAAGGCTFTAPFNGNSQYGQHLLLTGTYQCAPNGNSGTFFLDDFNVSFSGFTASYSIDGYVVGRLGGVRTGIF